MTEFLHVRSHKLLWRAMFCWPDFGQSARDECRPLLAPLAIFDSEADEMRQRRLLGVLQQ